MKWDKYAEIAGRPEQRVAMTRLRARIAERLIDAQQTAAMLTTFNEVDLTEVMALRSRYKESFEKQHGVKLSRESRALDLLRRPERSAPSCCCRWGIRSRRSAPRSGSRAR